MAKRSKFYQEKRFYLKEHCKKNALTQNVYLFILMYIPRYILKDRILRLKTIRKLIKNNRIESQDELLNYLQNEGFEVTQATLSRDLKLMKVGK